MKPPPADSDVMIECPLCGTSITYGEARAATLYPVTRGDASLDDMPGALTAVGQVECRCGRTTVDIQQRGSMKLAVPRPGGQLGGTSGPDESVIL